MLSVCCKLKESERECERRATSRMQYLLLLLTGWSRWPGQAKISAKTYIYIRAASGYCKSGEPSQMGLAHASSSWNCPRAVHLNTSIPIFVCYQNVVFSLLAGSSLLSIYPLFYSELPAQSFPSQRPCPTQPVLACEILHHLLISSHKCKYRTSASLTRGIP